jgi:hypothetical protein
MDLQLEDLLEDKLNQIFLKLLDSVVLIYQNKSQDI